MGQLAEFQANQLYPKKSEKIWFLTHVLNPGKSIERCFASTIHLTTGSVILVDDRTSDRTEEILAHTWLLPPTWVTRFKWKHSFSYAKNLCLKVAMEHGLEFGDWVLFMGADFELQPHTIPEIKEFVKDPCNFFAQFEVPEFSPVGGKVVSRRRKLLWRHHPMIYWEKSVHEEAVYSAYRLTGQGIPFGEIEWKEFPILGGPNGMIHYGFHEDGGEHGEKFWNKKGYYIVLTQIDQVRYKYNLPETEEGMREALSYILNRPVDDINEAIEGLTERYSKGDIPKGLSQFIERANTMSPLEYSI